jgi:O-glycosyl hydrolase
MTGDALKLGLLLLSLLLAACSPGAGAGGDSQTNWLRSCRTDSECGSKQCLCGVCTHACSAASACSGLPGASCSDANEAGVIAQCSGSPAPSAGLCMIACDATTCAAGQMCVAGLCTPVPQSPTNVSIDLGGQHQLLVGFGASIAYGEGEITAHPQKAALYQAIFSDLGLDVIRFRNRYSHVGDDDLTSAGQLYSAATASLGHAPIALLSSWSPPPALKANNALLCSGNAQTCTLRRNTAGGFDYAGFANYWRASYDAYGQVGIVPDYLGLQNNADWVPSAAELLEACRFLPVEGSTTVSVNGRDTAVAYPGYAEAQAATVAAFASSPQQPKILAPETSNFASIADYLPTLDPATTDALGHQLYGVDPNAVDVSALASVGKLESQLGLPVFITEMQADGFGTALMIHYAVVVEGAAAYLQAALTGSLSGPVANPDALIGLSATTFAPQAPYHAMRHFAQLTDPGWVRVDAATDESELLASAWLSPKQDQLTVVLINAGSAHISTRLVLPGVWSSSEIRRTVFSGLERFAPLGELAPEGIVRLPPQAVVTVALTR